MRKLICNPLVWLCLFPLTLSAAACSDDEGIDSDEEARRAYLGLDPSIEKCLELGFAGFNSASSANISPQSTAGDEAGTLTITGQVDQGSSDNKGMRLSVGMVDYSDGPVVIDDEGHEIELAYDTATEQAAQPFLNLSLRNIPNGTFDGTLVGDYFISGDIEGTMNLNLTMAGNIVDNGSGGTVRQAGTTTVTGTASTGDGTYDVNLQL